MALYAVCCDQRMLLYKLLAYSSAAIGLLKGSLSDTLPFQCDTTRLTAGGQCWVMSAGGEVGVPPYGWGGGKLLVSSVLEKSPMSACCKLMALLQDVRRAHLNSAILEGLQC